MPESSVRASLLSPAPPAAKTCQWFAPSINSNQKSMLILFKRPPEKLDSNTPTSSVQGRYAFSKTALGKRGALRSRIMAKTYGSILIMKEDDDFSRYFGDALEGRYDCVDRIVLNGYFPRGHSGGGFRTWWRDLTAPRTPSARSIWCAWREDSADGSTTMPKPRALRSSTTQTHRLAEEYLPRDPNFTGLFLILVAKAPALVWKITCGKSKVPHLEASKPWPYVNHYHFHFIDKEWGHLTIKMSGHPPFGMQVMLNAHEWVERRARKQTASMIKEGNCVVGGSVPGLDPIAVTLCDH